MINLRKYMVVEGKGEIDSFNVNEVRETRKMTNKEIMCLFALSETRKKYNFEIVFGDGRGYGGHCILKDKNGLWITWVADERNGANFSIIDNDCYDACISHLKRTYFYEWDSIENIRQKAIEYFNWRLKQDISDKEILQFATNYNYIDDLYFDDFIYKVKNVAGIVTINDEEADKRLVIRETRNHGTTEFQFEFIRFVIGIGKEAGISYKQRDEVWNEMSLDDWVKNILFKAVDISKYQELVIEALKKYDGYVSTKTLVRRKDV